LDFTFDHHPTMARLQANGMGHHLRCAQVDRWNCPSGPTGKAGKHGLNGADEARVGGPGVGQFEFGQSVEPAHAAHLQQRWQQQHQARREWPVSSGRFAQAKTRTEQQKGEPKAHGQRGKRKSK
jgi:hypothetical protein